MTVGVSVILTTYKRPDSVKRAFESILAQTWEPTEIIVVEDGCESALEDWIARLALSNVYYVRHDKNRGLAAARNTGLRLSTCKMVAYLDDDDVWLPDRLREQMERYLSLPTERQNELGAIQVGCRVLDPAGRTISINLPRNQGNLRESIMREGAATPSSCFLFLRSALLRVSGFDEKLISGIDHDIWMKLAVAGYSNGIIRKPLVNVYKNDRQAMMTDTERRIAGIAQYVEKWTPTYKEWFGESEGDVYGRRYFIEVVSRLAGQKLGKAQIRDGAIAIKAAITRAGWRPDLLFFAMGRIMRIGLASAAPRLRYAKRAIAGRRGA